MGERLAEFSLVGVDGQTRSGPTVVAYGTDPGPDPEDGTSFAAPRVSDELSVLGAYLLTLQYFAQVEEGSDLEGIPLTGVGYVDVDILRGRGNEHGWHVAHLARPLHALPALPRAGIDVGALRDVLEVLRGHGVNRNLIPAADRLRRMLIASARPVPGRRPFEVGHGFVSEETTAAYLETFSGSDLARVLGVDPLPPETEIGLSNRRLTDVSVLNPLIAAWRGSRLKWANDVVDFTDAERPPVVIIDDSPSPSST